MHHLISKRLWLYRDARYSCKNHYTSFRSAPSSQFHFSLYEVCVTADCSINMIKEHNRKSVLVNVPVTTRVNFGTGLRYVLSIKFRLLQLSTDEVQDWIGCSFALGAAGQRKFPASAERGKPVAEPVYNSLNWLNYLDFKWSSSHRISVSIPSISIQ